MSARKRLVKSSKPTHVVVNNKQEVSQSESDAPRRRSAKAKAKTSKVKKRSKSTTPALKRVRAKKEVDLTTVGLYSKEGQKAPCPPMGDPMRGFYESLLEEDGSSLIAIRYCIETGVLMGSQLKENLEKFRKLKEAGAFKGQKRGGIHPEWTKFVQSKSRK